MVPIPMPTTGSPFPDLREQVVNSEGRLKMRSRPATTIFCASPNLLNEPRRPCSNQQFQEFLLKFYVHYTAVGQQKHQRTDPDFYPVCLHAGQQEASTGTSPALLTLGRMSTGIVSVRARAAVGGHAGRFSQPTTPRTALSYPTLANRLQSAQGPGHRGGCPGVSRCVSATGDSVRLHLHDFQGKLVYLNFWKTHQWSLCLRDLAYAQDLNRTLRGQEHRTFVNIALDENEKALGGSSLR